MMRLCFVTAVKVFRTSTVLRALLCLAVALLVACGGRETPPIKIVDLAVAGQTVTKVRTAGNEVVLLEERLTSIFENGPQRTLAILQSDHIVHPYMPPPEWSVVDVAALPSGRYLALGTTGYVQNPAGASISEAAQPLLVLLNTDGSLAQNLGYIGGARHNQLTTIASLNGHWLLGGMINGPGTHSGDAQRELIVADGFLREGSKFASPIEAGL